MGVSDASNPPFVAKELQRLGPRSILDIGGGFRKCGVIAHECLEARHGRFRRQTCLARIEGTEIFEDYRNPVRDAAYDRVYTGDALNLVDTLGRFDAAIISGLLLAR